MQRIVTIGTLVIALLGADLRGEGKSQSIRFTFSHTPGHVVRHKLVMKNVGSMKMMDPLPEQKFSQTMEQEMVTACKKVNPDNSAVYEMTLPRISMNMSIMGMNMKFDSAADASESTMPGGDIASGIFRGISKLKLILTVGPDGQPRKLEGLREGMNKIVDGLGDDKDLAGAKPILDQMRGMFDDEMMAQQMQSYYRMIPPKRVARIGDTWENTWDMKLPMFRAGFEGKGEYELVGIETFRGRPCAKIRIKESFRTLPMPKKDKPDAAPASNPATALFDKMSFSMKSSGGDGIAYWDYKNGELVQLRQTQRMTIEIAMDGMPTVEPSKDAKPTQFTMVQKLNNSISIDLVDEKEAGKDGS